MARIPLSKLFREFSPIMCRLLARRPHARGAAGHPLSDKEIALASGISLYQVSVLSQTHCWDDIPVGQMRAFLRGCGIDFDDAVSLRQHRRYLKRLTASARTRSSWRYLRSHPDWESRWMPMLRSHIAYLESNAADA